MVGPNQPDRPYHSDRPDPDHADQPHRRHPLRIEGHLQPELSRWLWPVKWIPAIPHFVTLWILWLITLVLTVVAGIAVLFTGRYPPQIFGFTEGVLRWSWRVAFYALVLGCDKYPPFRFCRVRADGTRPDRAAGAVRRNLAAVPPGLPWRDLRLRAPPLTRTARRARARPDLRPCPNRGIG
ncbi:DUF4389 domain-containing protein [Actinopolymorpha singaporensis]